MGAKSECTPRMKQIKQYESNEEHDI